MAECLQNLQMQEVDAVVDDFNRFCKYFSFLDTTTCSQCNGFYASNFGQPLCSRCHSFLFLDKKERPKRPIYLLPNSCQHMPKLPQKKHQIQPDYYECGVSCFNVVAAPDHFCHPIDVESNTDISVLPTEVLRKIFSLLDDMSLILVSEVCQQWKIIVNSMQSLWKKHTLKRWPLYRRTIEPTNWFKIYSLLISSCFCPTCVIDEMIKSPCKKEPWKEFIPFDRKCERMRSLSFVVPISVELTHWHAYIAGPVNSPYEGGTFYLHIFLPDFYPFEKPIIKFLTKIIHPNISRHGNIGIDILAEAYPIGYSMEAFLVSIQSFLCDPYTKVCMEPELGRLYDQDRPRYNQLARDWTRKYAMMEAIKFSNTDA